MMRFRCVAGLLALHLATTSCSVDPDDSTVNDATGADADTSGSAVDLGPGDAPDSGPADTHREDGDLGADSAPDTLPPDALEDAPISPDLPDLDAPVDDESEVSSDLEDAIEADEVSEDEAEADLVDPECVPRTPPDTSAPWLVLGTGFGMYEPLEACQNVPIIQGIQGGHHVWGGLATGGYDATDVIFTMNFELLLEDAVIGEASFTDFLETCTEGFCYHTVPVIIAEEIDPATLLGQRLTLTLDVFPFDGEAPTFEDRVAVEPNEITF